MNLRLLCGGMVLLLVSACHVLGTPTARPSADLPASSAPPSPVAPLATRVPSVAATPAASSCVRLEGTGLDIWADQTGSLAWSHDGQWLAVTDAAGMWDASIWVLPVGRWQEARQVLKLTDDDVLLPDLAWSPDDTQLGFRVAKQLFPEGLGDVHVAQLDWRRGILSTLVAEEVQFYDWSAQNRLLAIRRTTWDWYPGLSVLDVATGQWSLVKEPPGLAGAYRAVRWTADEQVIVAYTVGTEPDGINERKEVYLLDWSSNSWKRLPIQFATAREGVPVLSPDGRRVAWIVKYFREWDPDDWRIMLYDLPTGTTTELVSSASNRTFPWYALAWSPDSQRLAFTTRRYISYYYTSTVSILTLDQPCSDADAHGATPSPVAR